MKKILIAALAVAALAACNKSEVVEATKGAPIAFENAFVNNATKATDITGVNIQDFGVYGSVEANGTAGIIFENTKVYKSGSLFKYDNIQYWIANAQYYFVAIAPFTSAQWGYTPTSEDVAHTGTIAFDNKDAAANQDLLFAYTKPEKTPTTITAQPEAVKFNFNHMLSKVAFKFTNAFDATSNISLKVYNVKINNAAAEGSLAVAGGVDGDWTAAADNNSFAVSFGPAAAADAAEIANNNGSTTTEYYYFIPTARDYNITFDVDLLQADVKVATYSHDVNVNIPFAKGTNYSLNTTLNATNVNPDTQLFPIEFDVDSVGGWDDENVEVVVPDTPAQGA